MAKIAVIANPTTEVSRRHDLDWLRITAVLMLIPYHTSRIFDVWETFYVKNAETSIGLTGIRAFLDPWGMPLLFAIAGAATWFAMRKRTGIQYLTERVFRLIIPLLFGLIVLVPPQAYLASLSRGEKWSFGDFFVRYLTMKTGEFMGFDGGFTLGHLWFILFLFVFSLLALPLFLFLKSPSGSGTVRWLAGLAHRPLVVFLLVIPFWLTEPLPGPIVGGLNPFAFSFLFVSGFIFMADARIQETLDGVWGWALGLGAISMAAIAALRFSGAELAEGSWQSSLRDGLQYLTTWTWVIGMLGFGHCYLNRPSRHLAYLNAAAYPFYLLHQTVIVVFGFYIIRWSIGILPKFLIIVLLSMGATIVIYELVRRWSITSALFGTRAVVPRHF